MSRYKLSNQIFDLGLDAQELSVYAYLCSLPTNRRTLDGAATICVKQSTIAEKSGIRATQTVSKIISRLCVRELIEPLGRSVKANRHKGTYSYAVQHLDQKPGYFFVDRRVFGMLTPRQMMIYLFLCKSFSTSLNICWNSYQDIAAQTGMKRELVIQTVNELEAMHLIVRFRKKARENNRMYMDNHYQIVFFLRGRIRRGKKVARLLCESNRTKMVFGEKPFIIQNHNSTKNEICQEVLKDFSLVRGSPPN